MKRARHRRFTDLAGFTRHCWECAHAKGWADDMAACEATGRFVYKFDSPNNQCSHVGIECDYEEEDEWLST